MYKLCHFVSVYFFAVTRTHCVETGLEINKFFSRSLLRKPPVVNLFKTSSKNCKTFIFKMRSDGATKLVERLQAVSVFETEAVEESVIDNNNVYFSHTGNIIYYQYAQA